MKPVMWKSEGTRAVKPWSSRNEDACVLVSSQAGIVPRVKLQKILYLSESRSMEKSESGSSGLEGKLEVRKESSKCRQASRKPAVKERQTLEWQGRKTGGGGAPERNRRCRLETGPRPLPLKLKRP